MDFQYEEHWTDEEKRMFDEMVKEEMDKLEREFASQGSGTKPVADSRLRDTSYDNPPLAHSTVSAERGTYAKTGRDGHSSGIMVRGQEWSEAQKKVSGSRVDGLPLDLSTASIGGTNSH